METEENKNQVKVSSFSEALNYALSQKSDSATVKNADVKDPDNTGQSATDVKKVIEPEQPVISKELRAQIANEELQKSINDLKKDGVDVSNIKSLADLAKSAKEAQKKITQLAQAQAEKQKTETEAETKKREELEKIQDEELQDALRFGNHEKIAEIILNQKNELKKLTEFRDNYEKKEKELEAKQSEIFKKEQSEEKRLDLVEDTFKNFAVKNKLSDEDSNLIRKFILGKQEDGTLKPPKMFEKIMLVDEINESNESDYIEILSEAFDTALKIVNAQKIGDPVKYAEKVKAEKQAEFDKMAEAIKKGEVIIKPKGSVANNTPNNSQFNWMKAPIGTR